MSTREIYHHIKDNTRQVFQDLRNDVKKAGQRFKAAPSKEKAWVLFKTFCVAVACGLITLSASALLGSCSPCSCIAAFVAGGTLAFYRFARSARSFEELQLQRAVKGVKQVVHNVAETVKSTGGNREAQEVKN